MSLRSNQELDVAMTALERNVGNRIGDFEATIDALKSKAASQASEIAALKARLAVAPVAAPVAVTPVPVPIDVDAIQKLVDAAIAKALREIPASQNQYPDANGKPVRFLIKPV